MSFLAPLFLLGAAAVALPIIFHLVRRNTRTKLPFSSLMFLRASPPRLSRRSRLEHWLLLLLRAAAVVLLAGAFARPFLLHQLPPLSNSESSERVLILLDNSASMQRTGFWEDAIGKVRRIIQGASPLDEVGVFTFARDLRPIMTFDEWALASPDQRKVLAIQRLAALKPEWGSTHIGQALASAAEIASDQSRTEISGKTRLVLVSDLQEGGRMGALQGYTWPNGVKLSVEVVNPKRRSNASLQLLTEASDAAPPAQNVPGVRVRVSNEADSAKDQFQVGWVSKKGQGALEGAVEIYVPAGQSRTLFVPSGVTNRATEMLRLSGDEEEFDNSVYVSRPEPSVVEVLYLGNEPENDSHQPLYYLRRALQATPRQVVHITRQDLAEPLTEQKVRDADLIVITESPAEIAAELRKLVEGGKVLLCVPKHARALDGFMEIFGVQNVESEEIRPAQYAMLAEIDFRHPVFASFADPRFSDFTPIHFWQYRRLNLGRLPSARILAKFDSGDPAILEVPLGRGRVFVMASGWDPKDSQLALSSKFVPLLYAFVEQSGVPPPPPVQYFVGDTIKFANLRSEGPVTVTSDAETITLDSVRAPFVGANHPGLFKVHSDKEDSVFAVNLDPAESRTIPMPVDELEVLRAPVRREGESAAQIAAARLRTHRSELENNQKLWRWLIVGCLGVLLGETWLAGRTLRRQTL